MVLLLAVIVVAIKVCKLMPTSLRFLNMEVFYNLKKRLRNVTLMTAGLDELCFQICSENLKKVVNFCLVYDTEQFVLLNLNCVLPNTANPPFQYPQRFLPFIPYPNKLLMNPCITTYHAVAVSLIVVWDTPNHMYIFNYVVMMSTKMFLRDLVKCIIWKCNGE